MKRFSLALALAMWVLACSAAPTIIPTKNMDRPTDMAFVCLAMVPSSDGSATVLSGRPIHACHQRGLNDPPISSNGERILGTFGLVANATRGELAVADMARGRLLDLTPAAPGYGMLPIGGDPESISSSLDGCWVATANRTTCDFTLINPSRLLADTFAQDAVPATPATAETDDGITARRITVKTRSGRTTIRTTPGEIAFLPSISSQTTCDASVNEAAVATFPGCDMVALLDFSFKDGTATISSAYYIRPNGFQDAGGEPVCPTDCATTASTNGESGSVDLDAGTTDSGRSEIDGGVGPAAVTLRSQPLALLPDGSRVYVGGLRDPAITSFDIGQGGLSNPARLLFAETQVGGGMGVRRIRLNVDPYQTTAVDDGTFIQGRFLDGRGRFLYAFTDDNSVRVVEIGGTVPVECDVNVLTTGLPSKNRGCFPIGSAPRRALSQGPGLHIPTFSNPDSPPPLPRDIAFANLEPTEAAATSNYHSLSGQFGFLLASNGQVYVINLDPKDEVQTATHSFREVRDVGKAIRTELAVSIAPQRAMVLSDQAFASTPSFAAQDGPQIRSFSESVGTTRWFGVPDPDMVVSRGWDVVWEGLLPQASRESGIIQAAGTVSSAGGLHDSGADFCSSGAHSGDVLMFSGCTRDSDCQPDDKFSCQVTVSGGRGVCLPRDAATTLGLTSRPECARFLGSRMRYEVAEAKSTSLALNLKLDEVPKTRLNFCETDSDCRPDPEHGVLSASKPDENDSLPHAFECLSLYSSPGNPASGDRHCVERCRLGFDSDCRAGNVCETVAGVIGLDAKTGLCVQAPPLDPTCFPQPMTRYSVRAGNSYVVYGSSLPRLHTSKGSATVACKPDTTANPQMVNRIPLSAPECTFPDQVLAKAKFVQNVSALSMPIGQNPCVYSGAHPDGESASTGSGKPHIRAFFENPQIRFVLANLEQYAGDLLSIHFEFQYGFVPLTIQIPSYEILLTMPTRILTGPTMTPESPVRRSSPDNKTYPYLYVIDQGRTYLTGASRGQVLRINPRAGSNEIATFDTAVSGSTPFQLQ